MYYVTHWDSHRITSKQAGSRELTERYVRLGCAKRFYDLINCADHATNTSDMTIECPTPTLLYCMKNRFSRCTECEPCSQCTKRYSKVHNTVTAVRTKQIQFRIDLFVFVVWVCVSLLIDLSSLATETDWLQRRSPHLIDWALGSCRLDICTTNLMCHYWTQLKHILSVK